MTGWNEDTTTICIPTLNSYDELWKCIDSIVNSSIKCQILIIDNGGSLERRVFENSVTYYKPMYNLGVAKSWNYFIDNTKGYRIISNDDIIFDQYAIEQMLYAHAKNQNSVFYPENLKNELSCFLLPDSIVNAVGKFDESISPMYAYFEDNDYMYRMELAGFHISKATGSFVQHVGSSTLKNFDPAELENHHRKFRAGRERYIKKWGGEPGQERYRTPYNR